MRPCEIDDGNGDVLCRAANHKGAVSSPAKTRQAVSAAWHALHARPVQLLRPDAELNTTAAAAYADEGNIAITCAWRARGWVPSCC